MLLDVQTDGSPTGRGRVRLVCSPNLNEFENFHLDALQGRVISSDDHLEIVTQRCRNMIFGGSKT